MSLIDKILASGAGILQTEYTPRWFPQDFDHAGQGNLFAPSRPRGLPIGNLTSQCWANVFLNELDHYVKRTLKCRAYSRYVDDFVLFHEDKAQLHHWRKQITNFLNTMRLTLHPNKSQVFPTRLGIDFLGFRHFPTHRKLRPQNARRFHHKLKKMAHQYHSGQLSLEEADQSIQSWIAHASHGDTWHLRQKMLASVPFIPPSFPVP